MYRYFINLLHTSMCQPVSLLSALCAMLFTNLHAVSGMLRTSEIADFNNIVDYLMHDRCLGKMRLLVVLDYMMVQKSRCVANVSTCRMTKTETLFKVERDWSVEETWCSCYCRLRCVDRHHLLNAWLRGKGVWQSRDGCHHCGRRNGRVIGDHIPPNKLIHGPAGTQKAMQQITCSLGLSNSTAKAPLSRLRYAACLELSSSQAEKQSWTDMKAKKAPR